MDHGQEMTDRKIDTYEQGVEKLLGLLTEYDTKQPSMLKSNLKNAIELLRELRDIRYWEYE